MMERERMDRELERWGWMERERAIKRGTHKEKGWRERERERERGREREMGESVPSLCPLLCVVSLRWEPIHHN